ncbi:hypothetical protein JCM10212_001605 [Sporobolomyces blumeae]
MPPLDPPVCRSTTRRKPLSSAQESRLISYLDPVLLSLQAAISSRHAPSSPHPTLTSFLLAIDPWVDFVLKVPSADPSGLVRVEYLLHLLRLVRDAVEAYPRLGPLNSRRRDRPDPTLDTLLALVDHFDAAWSITLSRREWNDDDDDASSELTTVDQSKTYPTAEIRTTTRIRLASLVSDLDAVVAASLNLETCIVPLDRNPFDDDLDLDARRQVGFDARDQSSIDVDPESRTTRTTTCSRDDQGTPELTMSEEERPDGETTAARFDSTDDETMSVATESHVGADSPPVDVVVDESDRIQLDENGDDDDDDDEFEAVEITSSHPDRASLPTVPPQQRPLDQASTFEIRFDAPPPPPPPTMTDGESGTVDRTKRFDPDEAYPPSSDDDGSDPSQDDDLWDRSDDRDGRDVEQREHRGLGRTVRERVEVMFRKTKETLRRIDGEQR